MSTARAIAGVVDGEVDEVGARLTMIGSSTEMQHADWAGTDALARRALGSERWLLVADLSGQEIVNTRLPPGTSMAGRRLDPAIREEAGHGAFRVSDLEINAERGISVLHVEALWPEVGKARYLMSIGFRSETLARAINVNRYAPGSIVAVIDRKGKIIARSLSPEQFVGKSVLPGFLALMTAKPEGILESDSLEHIPVLSAYCRTAAGWTVAIALSRDRLYSYSQRLLLWAVGVSALLTGLGILLASWISRALVRSVDSLCADAEALGRGEMPRLKSSGLTETDFVAGAMHRTADLLRQRTLDNAALHAELEQKVEQRTASLREAVNQMEEFSYSVSHDLRSPLRAMQGYAQILVEDHRAKLDPLGVAYLERIARAAERMDHLTSDLLSYSRLSRTQVPLVPVDLDTIVRDTEQHYIELQQSGAQFSVDSPLLPVLAHEPLLVQALSNLFTNAVKFAKPGKTPVIAVRTERTGAKVRIWIEDQGIGIPPQHQAALFRMFERLPSSGQSDGTGIGLAIVRKAAEKMGGSCGVESDGISGSRFWIELAAA